MREKYKHLAVSEFEYGLTLILGRKIKEIRGYISAEYLDPGAFHITRIVLDDDSEIWVEGEHDNAYCGLPGVDESMVAEMVGDDDDEVEEDQ